MKKFFTAENAAKVAFGIGVASAFMKAATGKPSATVGRCTNTKPLFVDNYRSGDRRKWRKDLYPND